MRGFAVIDAYQTTLQNGATMTVTGDGQLNLAFDLPKGDPAAGPHYVADYTVSEALQNLSADTQGTFTVTSGAVLNVEKPNPEGKPYAAGDGQINLYNTNLAITDGGSVNVNGSILAQAVGTEGPTIAGIAMDHGKLTVTGDDRVQNMGYSGLVQVNTFQAVSSDITIQGRPAEGLGEDWLTTGGKNGAQWDVASLVTNASAQNAALLSSSNLTLNAGTFYAYGTEKGSQLRIENSAVAMGGSTQVASGIIYAGGDIAASIDNSTITVAPQVDDAKGYGIISAPELSLNNNSSLTVEKGGQLDLVNGLPKKKPGQGAGVAQLTAEEALEYLPTYIEANGIATGIFNVTSGSVLNVEQGGTLNIHNVHVDASNGGKILNTGIINLDPGASASEVTFEQGTDTANKGLIVVDADGHVVLNGGMETNGTGYVGEVTVEKDKNVTISGAYIQDNSTSRTDTNNNRASMVTVALDDGQSLTIQDSVFANNSVTLSGTDNSGAPDGAAVSVHTAAGSTGKLNISNSQFSGNSYTDHATGNLSNGAYGGAIGVRDTDVVMSKVSIENNTAESYKTVQGAGYYQSGGTFNATGLLVNGNVALVEQNDTPLNPNNPAIERYNNGGGMALYGVKGSISLAEFKGNSTYNFGGDVKGGGLYVSSDTDMTLDSVVFEANSATAGPDHKAQGGAIYNEGKLTFTGTNAFTGNTAAEGKDIYNEGTLDFAGTNTQMDGGMVMADGTMTVANSQVNMAELDARAGNITVTGSELSVSKLTGNTLGSSLTVDTDGIVNIGNLDTTKLGEAMNDAGMGDGSAVLALNTSVSLTGDARLVVGTDASDKATAVFGDNSLLVVDAEGVADKQVIHADGNGKTAFIHSNAQLRIINAVADEYVTVLNGFDTIRDEQHALNAGWVKTDGVENLDYMLSSYAMITDEKDVVVVSKLNDPTAALPGIDPDLAPVLNEVWANKLNDVDSPDMGVRFLSRAARADYINGDAAKSAATIESAARIAFAGAVPQMTKMASDAATNAVVNRLGFANPADGAQAMNAEGKIVDRNTTGFALWIAPLWQNQHGWGMEAGNLDYGFNGNLGGVSLGADYTFENAIRAGITFNIGGGYAESSGGDLNSTENRMTFWGLGAYAGWNYENFGLMADVSYTSTWNDLEQDLDPGMGMGDLEADVQATAISAGLRAEYKLETSVLDIIPHIGVRYMSLNTWGYDVDANGGTVLEGDGFHQDIWTFPIGVTFSKDFTLDSGWFFKPSVDFSVIPAAGDIKAKHDVQFTGAPAVAEMETQMMDYLTWQGGVGIQMGNDNLSFGVNYTLQAGQNTTGHGVFGSFRYEF